MFSSEYLDRNQPALLTLIDSAIGTAAGIGSPVEKRGGVVIPNAFPSLTSLHNPDTLAA